MRANLAAWLLVRRTNIPWVAHVHGWLGSTHAGRWILYEGIDRQLIRRANLVIVGSDATRKEVEAAGGEKCGGCAQCGPVAVSFTGCR